MSERIEEIRARVDSAPDKPWSKKSAIRAKEDIRFLLDALSTRDAEIERLKDVAVAAMEAAATFRFYASNHTAKGTEDGDAKAARNVTEAKKLEDAVRQWTEAQS